MQQKSRHFVLLSQNSGYDQRTRINRHRGTSHDDARALAVLYVNPGIVDDQACPCRAFEHDAAGRAREITDHQCVLQACLENYAWANGIACERQGWNFGHNAPESAHPDGIVRVALFEFDPHAGAYLGKEVSTHQLSGKGNAWHRPCGWNDIGNIGHHDLNAANLHRVDIVDDRSAILSVIFFGLVHAGTTGTVEISPLRASEKSCLYSPRLMW